MAGSDAPFRIGYVLAEYPSATETFVTNEIRFVREAGADVTVFALRRGPAEPVAGCRAIYRDDGAERGLGGVPSAAWRALLLEWRAPGALARALRNVPAAMRFAREARRLDIGHLHAHFAHVPADLAIMMAARMGVSVSFSAHAWDIRRCASTFPAKLRRASLCLTCTDGNKSELDALVPDALTTRIVRVHHGTDLERFEFRPHDEPGAPARILAVGRLVPKKGFSHLLRAVDAIRRRLPCRLVIVGEGPLRGDLERTARDLSLDDDVDFRGALPYADLPGVYAESDVLCAPSVVAADGDRDGLPNVVVEAMAAGLPVVASRLSGIPDAVEDGVTGLLTEPGSPASLADALERAVSDVDLRRRMTVAARHKVEAEFEVRKNSRRVFDALRSAAGHSQSFGGSSP